MFRCILSGVKVDYSLELPDFPAGKTKIRCCIFACTGDYPAQCEIGKFINGGVMACRRDLLKGIYESYLFITYNY